MAKGKASRAPRVWLMTDPRIDAVLLASARALPLGSAIILRHYDLPQSERRALFARLRRIARQRGHSLFLAGDERIARRWGADGFHGRTTGRTNLRHSTAVHDRRELALAHRLGADTVLISPVYRTASHSAARPLGPMAFRDLAMLATQGADVVALGGMNRARVQMMRALPVMGWAAIGALAKS